MDVQDNAPSGNAFLAQLAETSAATWHAIGAGAFPGAVRIETDNRVYAFRDGVFASRTTKSATTSETPESMKGLRLLGFLADEGGFWSFSPRWRAGAHAVLWKPSVIIDGAVDPKSFVLTSKTSSFAIDPQPQPWVREPSPASQSGVRTKRVARPPSIVRPAPASMTRIHASAVTVAVV